MKVNKPEQIFQLRKSVFRMSQPDFAVLLGVCVASVSRLETGKANPSGLQSMVLDAMQTAIENYGEQRIRGVNWTNMLANKGVTHVVAGILNFAITKPVSPPSA